MNTEKWTVVKKGNGKFSPRYSDDTVAPYWPFGTNADFDTLNDAINCLITTKKEMENKMMNSEEIVVFSL